MVNVMFERAGNMQHTLVARMLACPDEGVDMMLSDEVLLASIAQACRLLLSSTYPYARLALHPCAALTNLID